MQEVHLYWTYSGSTLTIEDAAVFEDGKIPELFQQAIEQDYIEKIYIGEVL